MPLGRFPPFLGRRKSASRGQSNAGHSPTVGRGLPATILNFGWLGMFLFQISFVCSPPPPDESSAGTAGRSSFILASNWLGMFLFCAVLPRQQIISVNQC